MKMETSTKQRLQEPLLLLEELSARQCQKQARMCRMKLVPVTHCYDKIPDKAEGREVVVHDGCGGRSLKPQVTLHPC